MRRLTILTLIGVALASLASAQAAPAAKKPPSAKGFGLEAPFEDAIPLPVEIFKQLKTHERTQQCLQGEHAGDTIEPSWFVAANVDLDGRGSPEVIVRADNACLWGANIGPFWVFRKTANGYEALLEDYVLGLNVLKSRTNGYSDIEAIQATAVQTITVKLRFNGRKYIHGRPVVQDIR